MFELKILQEKTLQRSGIAQLSYKFDDVLAVIDLFEKMEPLEPLKLSDDLCVFSQNTINKEIGDLLDLNSF